MKKHTAFTLIELVFVIIIMGILGKFGVEFLAKSYKSFIFSKVNNELQSSSSYAVELIASRLQYRIKDSVIARTTKASTVPVGIGSVNNSTTYEVLEWVGYDNEGFRGHTYNAGVYLPTWSGILDLDRGNANNLVSPVTNTTDINTTISNLSGGTSSVADIALYFIGSGSDITTGYGWDGTTALINLQQGSMHPVRSTGIVTDFVSSTGTNFAGVDVYEYYQLAWTAYAIINENGTLMLYWNYQPWLGESYNDAGINVKSAIIMEDVDTFRFKTVGSVMKIQVCVNSNLVEDYSLCKEKTIY